MLLVALLFHQYLAFPSLPTGGWGAHVRGRIQGIIVCKRLPYGVHQRNGPGVPRRGAVNVCNRTRYRTFYCLRVVNEEVTSSGQVANKNKPGKRGTLKYAPATSARPGNRVGAEVLAKSRVPYPGRQGFKVGVGPSRRP